MSAHVHWCPLLSHSYWPQRSCRKNPCYDCAVKRESSTLAPVGPPVCRARATNGARTAFALVRGIRVGLRPLFLRTSVKVRQAKNRSRISPKSVRFRKCEFFTPATPTTYHFNALKWTDFLTASPIFGIRDSSLFRMSSLVVRHWRLELLWCLGFGICDFRSALSTFQFPSPP